MRRLAIVLLPLLALGACGSDGPDPVAGDAPGIRVDVGHPDPLRVGPLAWTVTVANDTAEPVVLHFPSSQRADVALTRNGEEVYRWSRGLMFAQVLGTERLAAGEKRELRLDEPGLDVDPGEYTLSASIAAKGRPDLDVTRTVKVEAMR